MSLMAKLGTSLGKGATAMAGGLMGRAGNWVGDKIFGGSENKRQLEQQKKLMEQQIAGQKEMGRFNQQLQEDMYNKYNTPEAKVKQLKDAGLSASLMYGGQGAGGATAEAGSAGQVTGGANADSPSNKLMAAAQLELMSAQAEKTRAEADNISGGEKEGLEHDNKAKAFNNDVRELVGYQGTANAIKWANEKIQVESEKANADWEAYKAGAFDGKSFDDKNSPIAKAMNAGFNDAVEQLKKTKLENNAKEAENVVKEFEARMAENGIHPNSPWYVKLIGDLLEKVGITDVIQAGAKKMK